MTLYVGEGPRGSNGAHSTLHRISATPSATHNQIGPLWCWFLSGWACACSRPLWVSPTTSPVSLSCCCPNPHGRFQSEVCGFISPSWSPGLRSLLRSLPFVPVYLCTNVGLRGATHCSACPIVRHSESGPLGLSVRENVGPQGLLLPRSSHTPPLSVLLWPRESSPPWLPISAPPTGLDECLFCISLVSDFLAVQFSVSSGCARRCSVSTYATILVL